MDVSLIVLQGACLQWARAGAAGIVLAGRRESQLIETVHEIENIAGAGGIVKTLVIPGDVSVPEDVTRLFDQALDTFGHIDAVVHSAGVLGPVVNIGDSPIDEWWNGFVSLHGNLIKWMRGLTFRIRCAGDQYERSISDGTRACYSDRKSDGDVYQHGHRSILFRQPRTIIVYNVEIGGQHASGSITCR